MAPSISWSNGPNETFVVPRIEDHLIDDLFYQEEEIADFRHEAFMIECGLEEDPPDGPDVPPVPWTVEMLRQQQKKKEADEKERRLRSSAGAERDVPPSSPRRTVLQSRRHSCDDTVIVSPQPRDNLRRSHSADGDDSPIKVTSPTPSPIRRRRLVATKSGTLHGMRRAATAAAGAEPAPRRSSVESRRADASSSSPRRRQLVATKSGTKHGLKRVTKDTAPKPARRLGEDENDGSSSSSEGGEAPSSSSSRPPPSRRLAAAKSGTKHGLRRVSKTSTSSDSEAANEGKKRVKKPATKPVKIKSNSKENKKTTVKKATKSKDVAPTPPMASRSPRRIIKYKNESSFDSDSSSSDVDDDDVHVSSALSKLRAGRSSPAELLRQMQDDVNANMNELRRPAFAAGRR